MESQMNKSKLKLGLILSILVLVALFAAFWAASIIYQPNFPERRVPPSEGVPGDFEFFYIAQTIVSTINIALLIILVITYASIYRKTHSEFTVGLLLFATVFLMKDFAANPLIIAIFGFRGFGLGPFVLLPELFEAAALSVLLYLSIKY